MKAISLISTKLYRSLLSHSLTRLLVCFFLSIFFSSVHSFWKSFSFFPSRFRSVCVCVFSSFSAFTACTCTYIHVRSSWALKYADAIEIVKAFILFSSSVFLFLLVIAFFSLELFLRWGFPHLHLPPVAIVFVVYASPRICTTLYKCNVDAIRTSCSSNPIGRSF